MIEMHRHIAQDCTRQAFELMIKPERTPKETIDMIHRAHAACYHMGVVGPPANIARCQWLLSVVYAQAGLGNDALIHAQDAVAVCRSSALRGSALALGLSACAAAYEALGEPVNAARSRQEALLVCEEIQDEEEKRYTREQIGA